MCLPYCGGFWGGLLVVGVGMEVGSGKGGGGRGGGMEEPRDRDPWALGNGGNGFTSWVWVCGGKKWMRWMRGKVGRGGAG